jgi:hypothetical protein
MKPLFFAYNRYNIYVPKHVNYNEYLTKANFEISELCCKAYRLMVETGETMEYEFPYVLNDKDALDPVMEAMIEAMTSTEYYENAYNGLF